MAATMVLGVIVTLGWSSACSYEASLGSSGEPLPESTPDAAIDAPPEALVDAPPDASVDASVDATFAVTAGPAPPAAIGLDEIDARHDPPGGPAATTR